ncbi:MAG: hypothetical protein H0U44_02275 [Flavisolibacter sp.]|jgi:hypothetical protein|nr:hypothetical protein [Flavisolibacter sp.]
MKTGMLLFCLAASLIACKKDNQNAKVTYRVTGSGVSQFKISNGATEHYVNIPFTGTRDTTVYLAYSTNIKLDLKADGGTTLQGTIFVNNVLVSTLSDADIDGDNKTEVKLAYLIPGK